MTYEGIEFTIRAGLRRNEWTLLITYPDRAEPFVTQAISVGQISRLRRREFIMLLGGAAVSRPRCAKDSRLSAASH